MSNSIGDLKNSGLKGNNFPYQLKSLQGLEAINNKSAFSNIMISTFTDSSTLGLVVQIQALFTTFPNSQLISQNILWDGVNYVAFITHTL